MQITSKQQPFQTKNQSAKKRPLANPFGTVNINSGISNNEFERLDSFEQVSYGTNESYTNDYSTGPSSVNSFSQDTSNHYNSGEAELQNPVIVDNGYQQNRMSLDIKGQQQQYGSNDDFAGFEPASQMLQAPVEKANSVLGSVFGIASMFMGMNQGNNAKQVINEYDEENEPPLLEDLGIDLKLIKMRALSVLKFEKCKEEFVKEADMSGPLLLFLTLASLLLLTGKVHFGYIYGFGVIGTIGVYLMTNLISQVSKVQLYNTMSILGYCLFPIVVLAFFNVFLNLVSFFGFVISAVAIGWATLAATNFFQVLLNLDQQKWLIAYPVFLFYLVFVIITIF